MRRSLLFLWYLASETKIHAFELAYPPHLHLLAHKPHAVPAN